MTTINPNLAAAAGIQQNQTPITQTKTNANATGAFASMLADAMLYNSTASLGDFSGSAGATGSNGLFGSGNDLLSAGLLGSLGSQNLLGTSGLGTGALSGLGGLLGGTSSSSNPYGLLTRNSLGSLMLGGSDNSGMVLMLMMMLLLTRQNNQANSGNSILSNLLLGSSSFCDNCLKGDSTHTSQEATPVNAWEAANPVLTNRPGSRSAAAYRQVINQFDVENNKRYAVNKNGTNDTYCNIYAWDVTAAMGAEIPHYIDPDTGAPMKYPNTGGAKSMNANAMNDWLNKYGKQYGWYEVTAEEAQYYANQGMPAVTSWKNPKGHGHMQVVSPSQDGTYNEKKGVAIAQAGRTLRNYGYITQVYGDSRLKEVQYFAHI